MKTPYGTSHSSQNYTQGLPGNTPTGFPRRKKSKRESIKPLVKPTVEEQLKVDKALQEKYPEEKYPKMYEEESWVKKLKRRVHNTLMVENATGPFKRKNKGK